MAVHQFLLCSTNHSLRARRVKAEARTRPCSGVLNPRLGEICHDPERRRRKAPAPVRGSAACEEAASAEDKDVTRCNHDTIKISNKQHNSSPAMPRSASASGLPDPEAWSSWDGIALRPRTSPHADLSARNRRRHPAGSVDALNAQVAQIEAVRPMGLGR